MKKKLLAIYFFTSFFVIAFLFFYTKTTLDKVSKKRREDIARIVYSKIAFIVESEKNNIKTIVEDWGEWDDLYYYALDKNKNFELSMLQDSLFKEDFIDLIIILNKKNKIIFSKLFLFTKNEFIPLTNISNEDSFVFFLNLVKENRRVSSFVSTKIGSLIVASSPILKTDGRGPSSGTLIMGKFLRNSIREKIEEATDGKVKELKFSTSAKFKNSILYLANLLNSKTFCVSFIIKDLIDKPFLKGKLLIKETFFKVVKDYIIFYFVVSIGMIVIFGSFIYFFIERILLKRIGKISHYMKNIKTLEDIAQPLEVHGNDELSELSKNINQMLLRLKNEEKRTREMEQILFFNEKLVALGRLVSNIAHELNNPLLAVRNSVHVISKALSDSNDTALKESIEIAKTELERMKDIISALLGFQRETREKIDRATLEELIKEVIKVLKWSKKIKETKVDLNISEECKQLKYPKIIQRILFNLLNNSIEAMKGKGVILIESKRKGKFCTVIISDTGPGISSEVSKKIFEPFFSTKTSKGVGLGLYISFVIAKEIGGELFYDSGYKNGARFILKLPLKENYDGENSHS